MADTFKFPNGGYDVTVLKRQDILDCIDANIIDKEVALAIVDQCELDAAEFIKEGRWTGLPFIGNVRVPKAKLMEEDPVQQALIDEAKATLDSKQYIMFRRQLSSDNHKKAAKERYFNYIVSQAVTKNRKLYLKLCDTKGEHYAKIFLFASKHVVAINNEYVNLEDDEQ
jgi:hypothetical protein